LEDDYGFWKLEDSHNSLKPCKQRGYIQYGGPSPLVLPSFVMKMASQKEEEEILAFLLEPVPVHS
jgi:hypothetical protein